MANTMLNTLANRLKHDGWSVTENAATDVPNVAVDLGSDFHLVMFESGIASNDDNPHVGFLEMIVMLPFTLKAEAYADTALMINHINRRIPLMGFMANTDANRVGLRHVQMIDPIHPDAGLVSEAVTLLQVIMADFVTPLHLVGTGEQSFNEAVKDLPF